MVNEKRLIEETSITEKQFFVETEYGSGWVVAIEDIADAPTADAVEVKHGEWIACGDGEYVPFKCTVCGKNTSWYHAQTANYCPNCGAKMDLEE